MSFTIVISHYNENRDWIQYLPSKNIHMYSKGGVELIGDYTISYLPNIGRESHTYLHYIIEHYDNLPDVVFFTQGCDDHIKAEQILKCCMILLERSNNFGFITNHLEERMIDNIYFTSDHRFHVWNGDFLYPAECNFKEWFTKYICSSFDFSTPLLISFAACFGVRKELILSRSKDYYKSLIEHLSVHRNTEVGHFFERSWLYIFNSQDSVALIRR